MPRSNRPLAQGDRVRSKEPLGEYGVRRGAQGTVCRVGSDGRALVSFDRGPKLWVDRAQVAKFTPRTHARDLASVADDMTLVARPGPPGAMRCVAVSASARVGEPASALADEFADLARDADEALAGGAAEVEVIDPACRGARLVALGVELAARAAGLRVEAWSHGPHVRAARPLGR